MSLLLLLTGYPQGGQGIPPEPEPEPEPEVVTAPGGGGLGPFQRRRLPAELVVSVRDYREMEEELVILLLS